MLDEKDNMEIKMEYDVSLERSSRNLLLYVLLSVIMTILISLLVKYLLNLMNYRTIITNLNRSDYLAIFSVHGSIVFLTTSLMAMLSNDNRYVYWVEMVTHVLIEPKYIGFFPLAVYAISTFIWSIMGFWLSQGWIVIGSFFFGIISVIVLFSRIITIYYQQEKYKLKIEKFLMCKIINNDYEKYLFKLKEITFIKAEKRKFYDVYDNLNLIEKSVRQIWTITPRLDQIIFYPEGLVENLYVDLMIDLAIMYPYEMQNYIELHVKENDMAAKFCHLVYPTILNSFLKNDRKDLFYRIINKWGMMDGQSMEYENYILNKALSGDEKVIAEYYSMLFDPYDCAIKIPENEQVFIAIIQEVYWQDRIIYEKIMSFRGNRRAMCMYFFRKYRDKTVCFLDILVICAEISSSKRDSNIFIKFLSVILDDEVIEHDRGTTEIKENIENAPKMYLVIKGIIENRRAEDVEFLVEKILELINDLDSGVYINASSIGFYHEFENWALDDALIKNKKELEKNDIMHHSNKHKCVIDVLQNMLEKQNYMDRRKSK